MNRRLLLATAAVALLLATAGCATIFGGGISDEELDREADYDDLRDRDADVVVGVDDGGFFGGGEFRAVYDLNDTAEVSLYRSTLYNEEPLDVHAVRYWYPNGTEVTGSQLAVEQGQSNTNVRVPDGNGTLAFSGETGGNSLQLPAYVEGSYEVILPAGHRTSNVLFGDVAPGDYDREVDEADREHLTWEHVDTAISVQYYGANDVSLFVGFVGVALALGGIGIAYYYHQIRRLRERREELGLDVDAGDESDRRPPPGFR